MKVKVLFPFWSVLSGKNFSKNLLFLGSDLALKQLLPKHKWKVVTSVDKQKKLFFNNIIAAFMYSYWILSSRPSHNFYKARCKRSKKIILSRVRRIYQIEVLTHYMKWKMKKKLLGFSYSKNIYGKFWSIFLALTWFFWRVIPCPSNSVCIILQFYSVLHFQSLWNYYLHILK